MAEMSPMMRQYMEIKGRNSDSILFFRLGDFYEMFYDDARMVSEELDLVLTGKDCGLEERAPMCGIPYHSYEAYLARLLANGHKVAICEQIEDPAKAKGIVKRDVVRIVTPGTVTDDTMLDEGSNNYLASVYFKDSAAVCFVDVSTGEAHATELFGEDILRRVTDEIMRFKPSEVLISGEVTESLGLAPFFKNQYEGTVTEKEPEFFGAALAESAVCEYFRVGNSSELSFIQSNNLKGAIGAVIGYLQETGMRESRCIETVDIYTDTQFMRLDTTAVRNLELCETMRSKSKKGTLLWVLDKTRTAMGKRLIKSWIEKPLVSIPEITLRQNAVEELISNVIIRGEVTQYMAGIRDVERLITKTGYGNANARDLLNLAATARSFPYIKKILGDASSRMLKRIEKDIDPLEDIADLIEAAIDEEAPFALKDGGLIKKGYSAEVDELRHDMNSGTDYLTDIEMRERERTGIRNLKVRYNKVFGYYIEVTNSFLDRVPDDYIRKQTLTNCERYITDELKKLETRVLTAKDRVFQLEYEIFDGIRKQTAEAIVRFQKSAAAIAALDVLCSFARVASENNYCRPLINSSNTISIKAGKHPVIEQLISTPFVANDTLLDCDENRCAVITGPNMAGKSTYMRQTALITLMAQIGSFVPAQMAEIGIVDAIYTRVGASDDLASGQSTFMVEMSEVAEILKTATKNSLLILDEIGRGTSTFDGMSIAKAVIEYVVDKKKLGAKTLFATHYHEITEMENELKGVKNYNIAVKKRGDDIIFLRKIVAGGADRSYGIEVAKLSGIPSAVIERAKQILKKTEAEGVVTYKTAETASSQLPIELQGASDLLHELQSIDVNSMTPIEAMGVLFDLTTKAKSI